MLQGEASSWQRGQTNPASMICVLPNQGILQPFEKIPVFFRFSPRSAEMQMQKCLVYCLSCCYLLLIVLSNFCSATLWMLLFLKVNKVKNLSCCHSDALISANDPSAVQRLQLGTLCLLLSSTVTLSLCLNLG